MTRRRYESDSSADTLEDYPLLRTPRLCGGHGLPGTSGAHSAPHQDSSEDESSPEADPKVQPKYSKNLSKIKDFYDYLNHLCDFSHKRHHAPEMHIMHKCKACGKDRTRPKLQCGNCKVHVHAGCSSDDIVPIPCIHPTPIADIKHPDLKKCTASLPLELPRVPAILVKCFYELQKEERIETPNMYAPPSSEELPIVEKLSVKLRRSVNRMLDTVPTPVVAGCVLKFLADIRGQLLTSAEEDALIALRKTYGHSMGDFREKAEEFVRQHIVEPHRLQTLAALVLHLRTIDFYRHGQVGESRVYEGLEPIFRSIVSLFFMEPDFWLGTLTVKNKPSASSSGLARLSSCCRRPPQQ